MKVSFGKILIGVAVFGICLGAAFAAGTVYGRHSTTSTASAASIGTFTRTNAASAGTGSGTTGNTAGAGSAAQTPAVDAATPQAGNRGFGGGFGGGIGGRPIEGKVDSVSNGQLQVTLGTGASTTVAVDAQTTYASSQKSDQSSLKTGASVYVTTAAASDGTLTAQSIIVLPASQQTTGQPTTTGGTTTGGRGGFGGAGGANRPVDGTVASVNGQQLEITLANGSKTTVALDAQTTYATTQKADQSAVAAGSSVLITISRGSDGTLTAQSVVVMPASGQ